jgi:hypothetical protein
MTIREVLKQQKHGVANFLDEENAALRFALRDAIDAGGNKSLDSEVKCVVSKLHSERG